jgi:GNAT superfamily N-acetyltransferase
VRDASAQPVVRRISAEETYPLRLAVLRPGRPPETARFAGDELETTSHWGAFSAAPAGGKGERLVAIASLYAAPHPHSGLSGWQLRGMASDPTVRGQGFGRAVLEACVFWLRQEAPEKKPMIWCNARTGAVAFYRAAGFATEGEEFEIPDVGPHWIMSYR